MAETPMPSVRKLARSLKLSHTTVSEALRNSPRVKPATRRRVLAAAREAGYRHNPLASALMSEMRRSRAGIFRGMIAVLDLDNPERRATAAARYHRELLRGASARATELGFKAESVILGDRGISAGRLDSILQARGIRGVFILPVAGSPDLSRLDWSRYAGVYADYVIDRPALHSVCPDHYRSMVIALERLEALGYRRPGLALEHQQDERLLYRWEAAFTTHQRRHRKFETLAPLITPRIERENFIAWFQKRQPDVVVCHRAEVIEWMEEAGASVPRTHGFCCLNVTMNKIPCGGLDLQPMLIGARGVELLIGQIYHNEYGVPPVPSCTTIPAHWVEGKTLREPPAKPPAAGA